MDKPANDLSILIIKPDLDTRGLRGELMRRMSENGLGVVFSGFVQFDFELIMRFYQWDKVIHPMEIGDYLCSEPLEFLIISGKDAIMNLHGIKCAMRSEFTNSDPVKNLMHCSDAQNNFMHEFRVLLETQPKAKAKTMDEIKTNNQVEVILYKRLKNGKIVFLMLKRSEGRGGFWQPITGNVKPHETFEEAAIREIKEETKIKRYLQMIDTGYSFDFESDGRKQHERIFGVEVYLDDKVTLSSEHTECVWVEKDKAINQFLKYPGNKAGLNRLSDILSS